MSNLRTYKAICDTTIKPRPPPKFKAKITSRSQGEFPPKTRYCLIMLDSCIGLFFLSSFTSEYKCQNALPRPVSPCFHPISILSYIFQALSREGIGLTRTKLTWFHFTLFDRFEAWSHRPLCQAPGLGSFLANVIASQVNVRNRRVDFQCFGKGLCTKTMSN